ncbi:hypothetical protein [Polyangium aurulentum]|uniref:hypothetical protein n=1 Tax=Polyangium aurulentum TaxID=2567896 RepID=UPI0010ADC37F|nr:hypothetical protein [Polyangium aurulentum]UQA57464.1 hypothetical protein E8A73_040295 [Polyangium aurulentum]
MSAARPPTWSSEPPPPPSRTRPRTGPGAFDLLSREGAAAVLIFARGMLEEELRRTPHLVNASLHVFAGRVQSAARSATEGVYRGRVFIAPLFRLMRERGEVGSCPTTAAFKARLLRAHARGLITLARCTRAENVNPLIFAASAVRRRRATFHVVLRWPRRHNVKVALEDTLDALDPKAYAAAEDYARKVHEDEQRREGRPRLITLSLDAFAARVQAVTNEASEDVLIGELFEELDARGEATGLGLGAFKARLRAAHRAGLLGLRPWGAEDGHSGLSVTASAVEHEGTMLHLVRRTASPLPIPWGRPAPLLRCARARTMGS